MAGRYEPPQAKWARGDPHLPGGRQSTHCIAPSLARRENGASALWLVHVDCAAVALAASSTMFTVPVVSTSMMGASLDTSGMASSLAKARAKVVLPLPGMPATTTTRTTRGEPQRETGAQRRVDGSAMDFEHLVLKSEDLASEIVLNRPDRRNALSLELMRELIDALHAAEGRVIVIGGAGPCFSAGHDLSEMSGRSAGFYSVLFDVCTEMMQTIQEVPQPVIAKVHGVATAAGCQLVASCDLVVAEQG